MRRHDREIKSRDEILAVMKCCQVCHVAFVDGTYPYVVPMTFGMQDTPDGLILYFHGARTGHKHDLLKLNSHVAFSMEVAHGIVTGPQVGACECTMEFDSVCGTGTIGYVAEEEKIPALHTMLEHYGVQEGHQYHFHTEVVPHLAVLALHVETLTGKKRFVGQPA